MRAKRVKLASLLLLALTACSGGAPDDEGGAAAPVGDDRRWPGGQRLQHYKGMDSYEWRVNILDNEDELLAAMQDVYPDLDKGDFTDVVSTCDAIITRGVKGQDLVRESVTRFSKTDGISAADARDLLDVSREYACPG